MSAAECRTAVGEGRGNAVKPSRVLQERSDAVSALAWRPRLSSSTTLPREFRRGSRRACLAVWLSYRSLALYSGRDCPTIPRPPVSAVLSRQRRGLDGGEGGIRTHGPREGTPVFKTGAFNRSATSPAGADCGRKLLQSPRAVQPDGNRGFSWTWRCLPGGEAAIREFAPSSGPAAHRAAC